MKQIVIVMLLLSAAWPATSQQIIEKGDKKHTTTSSFFRELPEKFLSGEKLFSPYRWEDNVLEIRNNDRADSLIRFETGAYSLVVVAKEYPVYHPGTNLIKEIITWQKDWDDEFFPYIKKVAGYDDYDRVTRLEAHYWDGNDWQPQNAVEYVYCHTGAELFYGYYSYSGKAAGWTMESGHRAVDEYNENNLLVKRTWQDYTWTGWQNTLMEEFFHNADGIVQEIIEYNEYNEVNDNWNKDLRMVFEIDNNMWSSAYIHIWDNDNQQWKKWLRQSEMAWYDFYLQKSLSVSLAINGEFYPGRMQSEMYDKDETVWVNLLRMSNQYNESGLIKLFILELWNGIQNQYNPVNKHEMNYDHLGNITFDVLSFHDGYSWIITFATKVDFTYNTENSIESYNVSYFTYGSPDNQFETFLRYEYYYGEEPTQIQKQKLPVSLNAYPNPASTHTFIVWNGTGNQVDISIIGIEGKVYSYIDKQDVLPGQPIKIELSHLKKGVYIIRCQNSESKQFTKVVKK